MGRWGRRGSDRAREHRGDRVPVPGARAAAVRGRGGAAGGLGPGGRAGPAGSGAGHSRRGHPHPAGADAAGTTGSAAATSARSGSSPAPGAPLTPGHGRADRGDVRVRGHHGVRRTDGGVITVTRTTDPWPSGARPCRPIPGARTGAARPARRSGARWHRRRGDLAHPTKSFGYLNDDERTGRCSEATAGIYSGDLGSLDEEGYLAITGRSKDLIIRGGQNISPLEIEQIVARHDAVSEVGGGRHA